MQHHFNKGVGLFALDGTIFYVDAIKFLGERRDRREVGGRANEEKSYVHNGKRPHPSLLDAALE